MTRGDSTRPGAPVIHSELVRWLQPSGHHMTRGDSHFRPYIALWFSQWFSNMAFLSPALYPRPPRRPAAAKRSGHTCVQRRLRRDRRRRLRWYQRPSKASHQPGPGEVGSSVPNKAVPSPDSGAIGRAAQHCCVTGCDNQFHKIHLIERQWSPANRFEPAIEGLDCT
jgi:hypothetical protein